jgi:hypothetical protein
LNTNFPERVLSEYPQIYNYLIRFADLNYEFDQEDLCKVVKNLVELYMQSSVLNFHKFTFVLRLYNGLVQDIPLASGLVSIEPITSNKDFLSWFVNNELS